MFELGKINVYEDCKLTDTMRAMRISDRNGERFVATDASNHEVRINGWGDAMNFCNTNGGYNMGNGDYYYNSRDDMREELQESVNNGWFEQDEVEPCVKNAPAYLFGDEVNGTIEFVPDEDDDDDGE